MTFFSHESDAGRPGVISSAAATVTTYVFMSCAGVIYRRLTTTVYSEEELYSYI